MKGHSTQQFQDIPESTTCPHHCPIAARLFSRQIELSEMEDGMIKNTALHAATVVFALQFLSLPPLVVGQNAEHEKRPQRHLALA